MPETGLKSTSGREGWLPGEPGMRGSDASNRFGFNSRECVHHAMVLCFPVSEKPSYLISNGRVGRRSAFLLPAELRTEGWRRRRTRI